MACKSKIYRKFVITNEQKEKKERNKEENLSQQNRRPRTFLTFLNEWWGADKPFLWHWRKVQENPKIRRQFPWKNPLILKRILETKSMKILGKTYFTHKTHDYLGNTFWFIKHEFKFKKWILDIEKTKIRLQSTIEGIDSIGKHLVHSPVNKLYSQKV